MRFPYMFFSLLILTVTLMPGIGTKAASSEQNLLLFYSNDVAGEIEPCG